MAAVYVSGGRKDYISTSQFVVTSFTEDYTIASNESTAGNIAAVLTTLIRDLIRAGIIGGTVVT